MRLRFVNLQIRLGPNPVIRHTFIDLFVAFVVYSITALLLLDSHLDYCHRSLAMRNHRSVNITMKI